MEQPVCERKARKDVQRNLERVLRAAHELFAEHGADVTMEEVARRAGVGVGTIYRRFPSKEHLFAAVSQVACADTHSSLHQAAHSNDHPAGKIRARVAVQYRRSQQQAALLDPWPASGVDQRHGAFTEQYQLYEGLRNLFEEVIADGQRQGIIRSGNPAILATLCVEVLSTRTFLNLNRIAGDYSEEILEYTTRFILEALNIP